MKKKQVISYLEQAYAHFESKKLARELELVIMGLEDYIAPKSSSSAGSIKEIDPNMFVLDRDFADGEFALYTDGACRGNPGVGAWAFLVQKKDSEVEAQASGFSEQTTNNKMELEAVIQGLLWCENHGAKKVVVYTDSKYIVDGMKSWVSNWKKRGWKKADKKEPENLAQWRSLDESRDRIELEFNWVKGHAGHPQNEYCDQLANKCLDENTHK